MFLRKKPNKSGSISVQVIVKTKSRKQHVVRTIGSSRNADEIEQLMAKGRKYISDLQGPLLPGLDEEENAVDLFVGALTNAQVKVVGPELIFGRLYDYVGYNSIPSEMFRHMVICRLYNPGSKLKTADYLERYLHVSYDISKIYRFLDSLCYRKESANSIAEDADVNKVSTKKTNGKNKPKPDYKSLVEQISYNHTKKVVGGSISVCFYDMTTLYFEATDEDDLRKAGFSKDGKHSNPQIFLGLLVASGGNPIGYEIYEGNIYEGNTIVPLVKALAERFSFGKPVVVADAGLLSKKNIDALTLDGYEYIIGARPKSESENIKERILSLGLKQGNIMEIDKGNGVRLILSSSEKRAHKDKRMREKGLARLQKKVKSGKLTKQSINNRGYNKYLKLNGTVEVSIDMNKFEADAAWDGIKGYLTNTKLSPQEVIDSYGNLWFIERAFRLNKFDLAVRPIYHRLRNRIEGHICICFTAYTILLELERILKSANSDITIHRAQELTKNMYSISYTHTRSKLVVEKTLGMDAEQCKLYDLVINATQA
jgi:transposase